eukprot:Gb_23586 [translate_table: standard]
METTRIHVESLYSNIFRCQDQICCISFLRHVQSDGIAPLQRLAKRIGPVELLLPQPCGAQDGFVGSILVAQSFSTRWTQRAGDWYWQRETAHNLPQWSAGGE